MTWRVVAWSAACGAGAAVLALAGLIFALVWHIAAFSPPLFRARARKLADVEWRTGDLIMTRHREHGVLAAPFLRQVAVHVGVVWVHPEHGPLVVDAQLTKPGDECFADVFTGETSWGGARAMRASEFLGGYQGDVYRRPVASGRVDGAALSRAMTEWGLRQRFDPLIASFQPLVMGGVALSTLAPWLGAGLAWLGGPLVDGDGRRLRGVYCTEFVAEVLKRAGALDPAFPTHLTSPLVFSSALGAIDRAAVGVTWGPEERVVP